MSEPTFFRRYMDILNEENYDPEVQAIIDRLRPPPGTQVPGAPTQGSAQGGQQGSGENDPEVQRIIDALRPASGDPRPQDVERIDLPDGRIIYFDRRSSLTLNGKGGSTANDAIRGR